MKIHGEKAGETVSESKESVKNLRKLINTRISKIKRGEGNPETHKKGIKTHLKTLARFSEKDYKEMIAKFESIL